MEICHTSREVFSFNAYPAKNNRKPKSGTKITKTLFIGMWLELSIVRRHLAESEGFEPSRAIKPCLVSSEVLSTTQPTLQYIVGLL